MIYELAGKRQLIVWLSEAIYGLDPATGKMFWKHAYPLDVPPQRPAVNIVTVKPVEDQLFVSTFYHGPMMLKVDANDQVSIVWQGKSNNPVKPDRAHCLMASPVFTGGTGYANGSLGELRRSTRARAKAAGSRMCPWPAARPTVAPCLSCRRETAMSCSTIKES